MDISLDIGKHLFNFRVGAIIKNGEKVLVHHGIGKEYVTVIGGRVQDGEDTITALIREVKEEIGEETTYVKPAAYIENFFNTKGKDYHEILVLHELELKNKEVYNKEKIEAIEPHKKDKLEFFWYDINDTKGLDFVPNKYFDYLKTGKDEFIHIVNDERKSK